jgi:neutral ceramidase
MIYDTNVMRIAALFVVCCLPAFAAGFRASAVKIDITPKSSQWLLGYAARQSTGVHDPIFHRVVAMDDGRTQFYLVSSDVCLFSPGLYDEVAGELERATGIPRRQFWWTVTHTHAAPEVGPPAVSKVLLGSRFDHEWDREYTARFTSSLIAAIKEAKAKLEPARLQTGVGMSMANINRRAKDVDGKVTLGLNPDGPADRQIGLMRLERPDGSLIALVANYAIHGTVMSGENKLISGDAPGVVAAYCEQKLGATVLLINGAAGNLAPIYSVYATPNAGHLNQFRVLLGDKILAGAAAMPRGTEEVRIRLDEATVESPLRSGLAWPAELGAYSRTDSAGRVLVRLPIRFALVNDTAIWSAPGELFCEIAIAVRNVSPFARTFYFGYTNGWFGYLPTSAAVAEGGYEPNTSVFTGALESDITEKVVTYLQGVK